MKVLAVFDDRNYDSQWTRTERSAMRAVIVKNGKIALVKNRREGYYKFPGGGTENGETRIQTLCRETFEEAGLKIKPGSVREIGMIHEIRRSVFEENEIFDQKSYYYYADVEGPPDSVCPDGYEAEPGTMLEWVDIKTAYETNVELGNRYETKFILREAFILGTLLGVPQSSGQTRGEAPGVPAGKGARI